MCCGIFENITCCHTGCASFSETPRIFCHWNLAKHWNFATCSSKANNKHVGHIAETQELRCGANGQQVGDGTGRNWGNPRWTLEGRWIRYGACVNTMTPCAQINNASQVLTIISIRFRPTPFWDSIWCWKRTRSCSRTGWRRCATPAPNKHPIATTVSTIGARSSCKRWTHKPSE